MKTPGPHHPISIHPAGGRVRVRSHGQVVAETDQALTLKEASLTPVHYLPRDALDMNRFQRSRTRSTCPYKGEACYYDLLLEDGGRVENAAWSYEAPMPAVSAIKDRLAFYTHKVDVEVT